MPLKLENGKWMGRVRLPGSDKRKTRCFAKKSDAVRWERLTRQRMDDFSDPQTVTLCLMSLIEAYLDSVQARLSRQSYYDKRLAFRYVLPRLGPATPVISIRYTHVEAVLNEIARTKSGQWANRVRTHLVACWNWGIRALGLPDPCPWRVERYKVETNPRYVPSEEDFWKAYEAAAYTETGGDTRFMEPTLEASEWKQRLLLTLLYTAGRKGEILGLTWEDVDFGRKTVRLWTRKRRGGLEYDLIPMTDQLRVALLEQRQETAFFQYVFINPKTRKRFSASGCGMMIPRICKRAKVRPFGFHAIRHLSASILAQANVPLPTIQAILRHKNVSTTSHYLHSLGCLEAQIDHAFQRPPAHSISEQG